MQPFNGPWSAMPVPEETFTHIHPVHQTSFINFLHLLQSIASSLYNLHAWQSFSTTCLQVLFGLPLVLGPSASYSSNSMALFFLQTFVATVIGSGLHAGSVGSCDAVGKQQWMNWHQLDKSLLLEWCVRKGHRPLLPPLRVGIVLRWWDLTSALGRRSVVVTLVNFDLVSSIYLFLFI